MFGYMIVNQCILDLALVPLRPSMNIIGCKGVFRVKRKANGLVERHKAHLVAKGLN